MLDLTTPSLLFSAISSVSYTPLGILIGSRLIKLRQRNMEESQRRNRLSPVIPGKLRAFLTIPIDLVTLNIIAVSYTHLDVYKRQVQGFG